MCEVLNCVLLYIEIHGIEVPMPLILFFLWIILNCRASGDVQASGVLAVLLVFDFCLQYTAYSARNEWVALKVGGMLLQYLLLLLWEMVLANIQVIGIVLSPKIKIRPCIIHFQPKLKSTLGRVLLANSITVVPGSVTAEMTDKGYRVHALTPEIAESVRNSAFEKLIQKMEGRAS